MKQSIGVARVATQKLLGTPGPCHSNEESSAVWALQQCMPKRWPAGAGLWSGADDMAVIRQPCYVNYRLFCKNMSGLQESKGIHHSLGQDDDSYIVLLMSFFKDGNPLMFIKRERAGATY